LNFTLRFGKTGLFHIRLVSAYWKEGKSKPSQTVSARDYGLVGGELRSRNFGVRNDGTGWIGDPTR